MSDLAVAKSVKLDANGNGVVQLGPVPAWRTWRLTGIALSATASDPPPAAVLNRDHPAGPVIGSTGSGHADVYGFAGAYQLREGQSIFVTWAAGKPGATATATAAGDDLHN